MVELQMVLEGHGSHGRNKSFVYGVCWWNNLADTRVLRMRVLSLQVPLSSIPPGLRFLFLVAAQIPKISINSLSRRQGLQANGLFWAHCSIH